jgi:hypothetical protein
MKFRKMVAEARAGDITVHYRGSPSKGIVGISRALSDPQEGMVTILGATVCWSDPQPGWSFSADYYVLPDIVSRRSILPALRALDIPDGPIVGGGSIRYAYFMRVSLPGLRVIREAALGRWPDWVQTLL